MQVATHYGPATVSTVRHANGRGGEGGGGSMSVQTVTAEYLEGIREGRATFREHGISVAADALDTLDALCRRFDASSPVGQMYRGERDFWKTKIRKR